LENSFQSISPETFRNLFLSVADYRFIASGPFRKRFVASGPFLYRFESIVIPLLHKRRAETFLSVSAGFSLQIRSKQKVGMDISE
jgi:hypothetical protein